MKNYITLIAFTLLLGFISPSIDAQNLKFKAYSASYKKVQKGGAWDKWPDAIKDSTIFTQFFNPDKIILQSNPKNTLPRDYSVVLFKRADFDYNNNRRFICDAVDEKGNECEITIIHYYTDYLKGLKICIIIEYPSFAFMYNCYVSDN